MSEKTIIVEGFEVKVKQEEGVFILTIPKLGCVFQVDDEKNIKPAAKETGINIKNTLTGKGILILKRIMAIGRKIKAYNNCSKVKPNTIFSLYASC